MKPPVFDLRFFSIWNVTILVWLIAAASIPTIAPAHQAQGVPAWPQAEAVPLPPPVAPPRDVRYPGVIDLSVDARDVAHQFFGVHETIPVQASGPMTLLYPQWIPGDHAPSGPLEQLAGLVITAAGQRVDWVRDTVDVFAVHLNVPPGAKTLELEYQYLGSTSPDIGRIVISRTMLALEWNLVVLYPSSSYTRDITFRPTVRLPPAWNYASALDGAERRGDVVSFSPVDLQTLVDSPVMAGRFFKTIVVTTDPVPVRLDLVADRPEDLDVPVDAIEQHKQLVEQAYKLFGSHHFDHYDFLTFLSGGFGPDYLEHHRSGEQSTQGDLFSQWQTNGPDHDELVHGFVHSWNGKFRRPADMWTPNFNIPQRDRLLWVYEGLTAYWQTVLSARSGLLNHNDAMNILTSLAAQYSDRAGAAWRPLQDTTNDEIIQRRRPVSWSDWQRNVFDTFLQGELIWLDADTLIRQKTEGKKSLDDFAKTFFGVRGGSFTVDTFTFEDLTAALNGIMPYDWASFFRTRLDSFGTQDALDGLTRGGYRFVLTDRRTVAGLASEAKSGIANLSYCLGLIVSRTGTIMDASWGMPGFRAGLAVGDKIDSVNGQPYSLEVVKSAVNATKTGGQLKLLVKTGSETRTVSIPWQGGLLYPHLERVSDVPAIIDDILTPRR